MLAILFIALWLGSKEAVCQHDVISGGRDFAEEEEPSYWKIIGGEEAKFGEFPFMLGLEYGGMQICGASAIGDYWALTAAHCVTGGDAEGFALRAGSLKRGSGGTLHKATKVYAHHLFSVDNNYDNDVAVIKVEDALTNNKYVRLVSLPNHSELLLPPGTLLTVSGWGAVGPIDVATSSPKLKKALVLVLSKATCEDDPTLSGSLVITDNMICAQEKGHTAYKGDSGGPLFLRDKHGVTQVGVVSWGDFTGQQKHPTVFTRLSHYRLWIHMKTGL